MIINLALFIFPIYLAHKMDSKMRTSNPYFHPYVFGYYVGLIMVMESLRLPLKYWGILNGEITLFSDLILMASNIVMGLGLLYRRRLAWIIEIFETWCILILVGIFGYMQDAPAFIDPYIPEYLWVGYHSLVVLVIFTPIIGCITFYYLKRRHEMPLV